MINKYVLIMLAILGIAFYFGFLSTGSLINIGEVKTQSYSFDGIDGVAESITFDTIRSNQYDVSRGGFCGDNDGDITISNRLRDGEELVLISTISTKGKTCNERAGGSYNYIDTNICLPAGTLKGVCNMKAPSPFYYAGGEFKRSRASCEVDGKEVYWIVGIPDDKKKQDFEVILDESRCVDVSVKTKLAEDNDPSGAEAELTLNFYPSIESISEGSNDDVSTITGEVIKDKECIQNVDCIDTCGIDKPTCFNDECYCDAVKEEEVGGVRYVKELNIFEKIWAWITQLFK